MPDTANITKNCHEFHGGDRHYRQFVPAMRFVSAVFLATLLVGGCGETEAPVPKDGKLPGVTASMPTTAPEPVDAVSIWLKEKAVRLDEIHASLEPREYGETDFVQGKLCEEMDAILLDFFNTFPDAPVDALVEILGEDRNDYPSDPCVVYCRWLTDGATLVLYHTVIWCTMSPMEIRVVRKGSQGFEMLRPPQDAISRIEAELGILRRGDLYSRYGGDWNIPEVVKVNLDTCCVGMRPLKVLCERDNWLRFALEYTVSSTCPSCWEVVWEWDGKTISPIGYCDWSRGESASNGESAEEGWRRVGEKSLEALEEEVRRTSIYQDK